MWTILTEVTVSAMGIVFGEIEKRVGMRSH